MLRTLLRWLPGLLMLGTLATAEVAADVQKLFDDGNYRDAEVAARRLLASLEPGGETLETARALDLLASIQVAIGASLPETEDEVNHAIAIKSRLLGPDDPAIAVSLGILGEAKRLRSEYPAAIAALERARAIQQKASPVPAAEVADVLHRLGVTMQDSGRYAEAIQLHLQVLEIREREFGPESATVAEVLNSLAADCWVSGQMPRAREYVDRSLRIYEKTLGPDHPATANALGTLGAILKLTQDFAGARPVYERAVAIMEQRLGPDHPRLAIQLNNLGLCLKELNEFERAAEMLERSVHMFERILGPDNSRTATVLANLGIIYRDLGDFTRARQAYERALTIQEKRLGPDHPLVASALNSLGLLIKQLGDYDEAKRYLSRSLDIYERKSGLGYPKTVDVMVSLGNVLSEAGDAAGAKRLLERAVQLRKETTDHAAANTAAALLDLGRALFRSGDYTQARARYEESLRMERELGNDLLRTGNCLVHLGELVAMEGDFEQAATYHREAIQNYSKTIGPENNALAGPMAQLASELSHLGRPQEALKVALDSERIWRQHLRLTLRAIPERQALLLVADGNPGLDEALRLAAVGPTLAAADRRVIWDAVIRGRALALDEMAERHRTAYAAGDPEAAALERQLGVSRTRLARLVTQGTAAARLDPARRQVEADEEALAGKIIEFRRELNARRTGYAETAAALPSGTALVAFVRYGSKPAYLAFVLKAGEEAPAVVPLGTAARIDALVTAWRGEIHREAEAMGRNGQFNEQKYRTAGAALRRAVWDPVAAHLHGAGAVFVVPDGALQLVNLNTLPVGTSQYLAESGMMLHTLSAERDIADERAAPGRGLLAVGNPAYQSARPGREPVTISMATYRGTHSRCTDFASMQFAPLPASAQEVRTILSIWNARHEPGSALLGGEATEAAFKQNAPGKRVIHLATHGFFLEEGCRANAALRENPLLRAGLALAGANRRQSTRPDDEDGILTAEEVASMNLAGAEWVVLSGCDTGDGEVRAGEGVLGLRRAFRIAGVGTLIASLWPVEDEAARAWMSALYQARFRQGRSTSESMTSAMLSQLRERRAKGLSTHPFHWGSFIAVGDWR